MKGIFVVISTFVYLSGISIFSLFIWLLTFGRASRWIRESLLPRTARLFLKWFDVKLRISGLKDVPDDKQAIYIANHRSSLDILIICALALPNTRYFMSRNSLIYFPMTLVGALVGTFYSPGKNKPEKRRTFFKNAARKLAITHESVFLTPEGIRIPSGEIGHFNKGAFHLALSLGAPLIPIYIHTPDSVSPGKSMRVGKGSVEVSVHPAIETGHWKVETLAEHIQVVRSFYLDERRRYKQFSNTSQFGVRYKVSESQI